MKKQQFLMGFLAASCLFLILSATTITNQSIDIPRYHIAFYPGNAEAIIYDAVTGEIKIHKYKDINDDSNLKDLLEKK